MTNPITQKAAIALLPGVAEDIKANCPNYLIQGMADNIISKRNALYASLGAAVVSAGISVYTDGGISAVAATAAVGSTIFGGMIGSALNSSASMMGQLLPVVMRDLHRMEAERVGRDAT